MSLITQCCVCGKLKQYGNWVVMEEDELRRHKGHITHGYCPEHFKTEMKRIKANLAKGKRCT